MKRLIHRLLPSIVSFLTLAAAVGVKPACAFAWHQPEVPKALRK